MFWWDTSSTLPLPLTCLHLPCWCLYSPAASCLPFLCFCLLSWIPPPARAYTFSTLGDWTTHALYYFYPLIASGEEGGRRSVCKAMVDEKVGRKEKKRKQLEITCALCIFSTTEQLYSSVLVRITMTCVHDLLSLGSPARLGVPLFKHYRSPETQQLQLE